VSKVSKVQVATTIAILADIIRNVGGDLVEVRSIIPPGTDVHSFQPSPSDSITISGARLIVSNGSGLDDALDPIFESARDSGAVFIEASEGLETMPVEAMELEEDHEGEEEEGEEDHEEDEDDHGDEEGHEDEEDDHHEDDHHLEGDPHFWQDPLKVVHYVERIRDGLAQVDPANAQVYQANADAYIQKLRELDREIEQTLSRVPSERRHLVTFHDAFGYFAQRYGWKVSAFVAHDAGDVTPGAVARVLESIKTEGIPAVFAEPQFNEDVMNEAAQDAGVVVAPIYSDALSDEVPTYIEMMRFNAKSLAEHLS
jgi:ABC-type Zn uptake system ZnuABC Zn-binding protein ZnuA